MSNYSSQGAGPSRYEADNYHDDGAVVIGGPKSGREVGVTRPKRRLSSLPSLPKSPLLPPHPSSENRAMSATSSPPSSPGQGGGHFSASAYESLQQQSRGTGYQGLTIPRIEEKVPVYTPAPVHLQETGPPKLFGIELKWISLVTLALQNASLAIIMHYSRIATPVDKKYSAAAAVLLNELLKGSVSTLMALRRIDDSLKAQPSARSEKESRAKPNGGFTLLQPSRLNALSQAVFSPDCFKLAIPAILYVIQNNLQYVAASNLDVATFQVTYQMKILTTAFFSVVMLGKRLNRAKWCALVLLAVGVGIVQLQSTSAPGPSHGSTGEGVPRVMYPVKGFTAVTLACLTSGLAGVYFELLLKSGGSSGSSDLWVRNTQLSLFSLVPAVVPVLFSGREEGLSWAATVAGKFSNFGGWAIATVLIQTFGGLVTALVIRYSDNIMKGFATSLSIVISFLASVALFNYPITTSFVVGAMIVLVATYLYNSPSVQEAPARTSVAVAPGSPIPTTAPILGEPQAPSRTASLLNLISGVGSKPGSRRPSGSEATRPTFPPLSRSGSYNNGASTPSTPAFLPPSRGSQVVLDASPGVHPRSASPRPVLAVDTRVVT